MTKNKNSNKEFEKTVPTKLIMEGMSDTININLIIDRI